MRTIRLAAACLLLGGCATSSLVLLPDDEGHQGAVAVLETNGMSTEAVINQGYRPGRYGVTDLLKQYGYRYAWSGLDQSPGDLNLMTVVDSVDEAMEALANAKWEAASTRPAAPAPDSFD